MAHAFGLGAMEERQLSWSVALCQPSLRPYAARLLVEVALEPGQPTSRPLQTAESLEAFGPEEPRVFPN